MTLRNSAATSLCLALLCAGCGDGGPPSSRHNAALGGGAEGTPFGVYNIDRGILEDQTAYTPVASPEAAGSTGGASAAAGSGDVTANVTAMLDRTIQAALAGEIETMLEAINDEQIAALKENTSDLHDTYEKIAQLCRVIGTKIGKDSLTLKGLMAEAGVSPDSISAAQFVEISAVDNENASIQLNLPAMPPGFAIPGLPAGGPTPEVPPIPVKKEQFGWKIQLPRAITEEEVAQFNAGLKQLHRLLDKLTDSVEKSEVTTLAEIGPIFLQTAMEFAAEMGAGEGATPPEGETVESPNGNPRMPGGGQPDEPDNDNEDDDDDDGD